MLAKVTGDILAEDLAGRTYIDVWGKGVQSLAGFECWPDLESANLGLGQITDISPLKDLAKLSSLVLTCNPITDLSPLANLPRLSTLFIGDLPDCGADLPLDNAVSLSLAQGLTVLQIERRNVPSLEFVRTLPRLNRLGLVKAGLSDISGLSRLGTLLSLDLRDNELSDLSEIAQLAQLIELDLSNNPRAIAESLSTRPLPRLTRLRLAGTGISDLAAIAGLSQVDHFELSNNQITDLTPFLQNERFGWAGSLELANNPFKCSRVLPQAYALAGRGIKVSGIEHCITKQ
jgi:internalin A